MVAVPVYEGIMSRKRMQNKDLRKQQPS